MDQLSKGTVVYSLEDAAKQLSGQQHQQKRPDSPVDILAIVSDRFDLTWAKGKECLRIVDFSRSAFITVKIVDQEPVKIGNIIRFNRVGLEYDRGFPKAASLASVNWERLPRFCHRWNDLDTGPEWMCLGHVSHLDGSVIQKRPIQLIPESMATNEAQLSRLVEWYLHSDEFKDRSPLLSQLPHCRRSIEELISFVGSSGDIVAKVEQVVDPPIKWTSPASSRKRRRGTASTSMGFAILSDTKRPSHSRHLATLLDPQKRFLGNLRNANDSNRAVLIARVVSMKANQLESRPNTLNVEDVVLVLTKESCVTLLSSSDASVNDCDQEDWQNDDGHNNSTTPFSLTGTQATVVAGPQSIQLEAHIVDIEVQDGAAYSNNGLEPMRSRNCAATMTAAKALLESILQQRAALRWELKRNGAGDWDVTKLIKPQQDGTNDDIPKKETNPAIQPFRQPKHVHFGVAILCVDVRASA
eukprot:scaffold16707_cov182-Amphora_coffeaeformis.AAC.2